MTGSNSDFLLEALEKHRVADSAMSAAYESAGPKARGMLKAAISMSAWRFGFLDSEIFYEKRSASLGLRRNERSQPVDCPLLAFSENCKAAARICAASLLPALAACGPAIAVCVGEPSPPALAALELAGAEDVFAVKEQAALIEALKLFAESGKSCAMVLLHGGELAGLGSFARAARIPCYEESAEPRLLTLDEAGFSEDLLEFAHGFVPACGKPEKNVFYDAIFSTSDDFGSLPARLVLSPAGAGFWLHRGLEPSFFRLEKTACGPAEELPYGSP